jgi:hypothetical protein
MSAGDALQSLLDELDDVEKRPKVNALFNSVLTRLQALGMKFSTSQAKLVRRRRISEEILSTERDYVQSLELLIQVFRNPLQGMSASSLTKLLGAAATTNDGAITVERLFCGRTLDALLNVHRTLCDSLDKCVRQFHEQRTLGELFVQNIPQFAVYSVFFRASDEAFATLKRCNDERRFVEWVSEQKERSRERCHGRDIADLLSNCVQRLPRYELLLKELLEFTDSGDRDSQALQVALISIKQITALINRSRQEDATHAKLQQLQRMDRKRLLNLPRGPKVLVKEGQLVSLAFRTGGKAERVQAFLFNDVLLTARSASVRKNLFESTVKHDYRTQLPLTPSMSVENLSDAESSMLNLSSADAAETCWKISDSQRPLQVPTVLKVERAVDRIAWIKALNQVLAQLKQKQSQQEEQ